MNHAGSEARVCGSFGPGLSEMQAGSGSDVGAGSETGFPGPGLGPRGEVPLHRLAPLGPGGGLPAAGPEVFQPGSDLSGPLTAGPGPESAETRTLPQTEVCDGHSAGPESGLQEDLRSACPGAGAGSAAGGLCPSGLPGGPGGLWGTH